jgi:hypothetical protein
MRQVIPFSDLIEGVQDYLMHLLAVEVLQISCSWQVVFSYLTANTVEAFHHTFHGQIQPLPTSQLPSPCQNKGLLVFTQKFIASFLGEVGLFLAGDELSGQCLERFWAVGVELDQEVSQHVLMLLPEGMREEDFVELGKYCFRQLLLYDFLEIPQCLHESAVFS